MINTVLRLAVFVNGLPGLKSEKKQIFYIRVELSRYCGLLAIIEKGEYIDDW